VKDLDFSYRQIMVREGKGNKDRVTVLPASVETKLKEHFRFVKQQHEIDLKAGAGHVKLSPGPWQESIPMQTGSGCGNGYFRPHGDTEIRRRAFFTGTTFMRQRSRGLSNPQQEQPTYPRELPVMPFVIPSPLTFFKTDTTSEPFRSSSATRT
jgi:hypothetical protein